jgi:hypothetical protein
MLARLRKRLPVMDEQVRVRLITDFDAGMVKAGRIGAMVFPAKSSPWKWLTQQVQAFSRLAETEEPAETKTPEWNRTLARRLARVWLEELCDLRPQTGSAPPPGRSETKDGLRLRVTLQFAEGHIQLEWSEPESLRPVVTGRIACPRQHELSWTLDFGQRRESVTSTAQLTSIRSALRHWLERFPANPDTVQVCSVYFDPDSQSGSKVVSSPDSQPFGGLPSPWEWLEQEVKHMAEDLGRNFLTAKPPPAFLAPAPDVWFEEDLRRFNRKEEKRAAEASRIRENIERLARERRQREEQGRRHAKAAAAKKPVQPGKTAVPPAPKVPASEAKSPLPQVPVHFESPAMDLQETTLPLASLQGFSLRERAALWWVSNQSDDLLCLPYCHVQRLDYQVRTALRVLGPLRGRALLSDEVGLGKTIEAGLVLKELLTRGMVKRFLVLTVPSLVDQWEEELSDKFGLATVTTNQAVPRDNPESFWRDNPGIIASLHTLKQPAQLEVARQVKWDLLIVDEAHYLRNRESQAWQAVSALPRQFLLLLTATPVQNSLEELYNLVTLLQPGQLPTPKEFRARFIDPKRPRQPREPEELRRLLGQVMVRNTRANAGLNLPPRRAETVLFEPEAQEKAFWQEWETEFRGCLARLSPSQASLWGRLLLQAAGSSPAAWREALQKFPDRVAAGAWRRETLLETSWQRKCQLLPPLTRIEGGAVIFTQFLQTQAALAEYLQGAGVETFLINGATPAPQRQPITEEFRRRGGALLLTHSGTEGRNLQFSHRLANFDLPWNPMEIEQRIGRLHRLGQQHPVRIYNFVQAGTLQEHLLQILQEKLNLFELVVGETGLVLGERFGGEEFAEEVLRLWRESEGKVAEAFAGLGEELAAARDSYSEVKELDETLFSKDYESA